MKKRKKISNIIGYIVSILCLLLCLYITIEVISANTSNRPPRIFGVSVSYVPTESMDPTIKVGDYVLFVQADFNDVKVDDIVIYRANDGKYIIHRIIEKYDDYLIAKGDNNLIPDDKVTKDMVYGKYITTLSFMSIFSGGISKNLIFFILVGIFICMLGMQIFSMFVKNKTDEVKKTNEEQKNLLREELKRQILEEELAKLREENAKLKEKKDKDNENNL
ncbi:MAG: signal peptidase I [Anaeroplasma sp.]